MTMAVLSTGGTIASTGEAGTDTSPELTADHLVEAVPALNEITAVETHQLCNVPSTHLSLEDVVALRDRVVELDADADVEGVVVTQGTDILEETAYLFDLWYDGATPIAFTGSMRNPSLPSPDGPVNLLAAVRTILAAHERAGNVFVAFNDRIHAPHDVTKTHSMNPDTFRSPELGPLATVAEGNVVWHREVVAPSPTLDPDPDHLTNDVPIVLATLDMTDRLLAASSDAAAVCLAATGAGHIPPGIVPALEGLRSADIPIVATTRCPEGRLARETYDFEGSERTLQELDCFYSDLNPQKTRIATIAALAADALNQVFERP